MNRPAPYKYVGGGSYRWAAIEMTDGGALALNVRWFKTRKAAFEWARPNFVHFGIIRIER